MTNKPIWHGMASAPKDRLIVVGARRPNGRVQMNVVVHGTNAETNDAGEEGDNVMLFGSKELESMTQAEAAEVEE